MPIADSFPAETTEKTARNCLAENPLRSYPIKPRQIGYVTQRKMCLIGRAAVYEEELISTWVYRRELRVLGMDVFNMLQLRIWPNYVKEPHAWTCLQDTDIVGASEQRKPYGNALSRETYLE